MTSVSTGPLPKGVFIVGAAKSGTTALFYAVAQAMIGRGAQIEGLFEPPNVGRVKRYLAETTDTVPLAKALLGPMMRWPTHIEERFEKRVFIIRDPRDNIVSRIVFMLTNMVASGDRERIDRLVQVFVDKEQAPDKISILSMAERIGEITGSEDVAASLRDAAIMPAEMKRTRGADFFHLPYEDLVTQNFAELSGYLGLEIAGKTEVDSKHEYVSRTKGSGDWKNWFLPEDLEYFVRECRHDYRLLGYDPRERPAAHRVIRPATCSEYVRKQFDRVEEKRRDRKKKRRALSQSDTQATAG